MQKTLACQMIIREATKGLEAESIPSRSQNRRYLTAKTWWMMIKLHRKCKSKKMKRKQIPKNKAQVKKMRSRQLINFHNTLKAQMEKQNNQNKTQNHRILEVKMVKVNNKSDNNQQAKNHWVLSQLKHLLLKNTKHQKQTSLRCSILMLRPTQNKCGQTA